MAGTSQRDRTAYDAGSGPSRFRPATLFAEESMAEVIERLRAQVEALQRLADRWADVAEQRQQLDDLAQAQTAADNDKEKAAIAVAAIAAIAVKDETGAASTLAAEARELIALVSLGRKLGLGRRTNCARREIRKGKRRFTKLSSVHASLGHP